MLPINTSLRLKQREAMGGVRSPPSLKRRPDEVHTLQTPLILLVFISEECGDSSTKTNEGQFLPNSFALVFKRQAFLYR
jgi:hypothetical protein